METKNLDETDELRIRIESLLISSYHKGEQGKEYIPCAETISEPKSDEFLVFEKDLNIALKRAYELGKLAATQKKAPSTTAMVREQLKK